MRALDKDAVIRRLRTWKLRLTSKGPVWRLLVPFLEVGEFSLSHGFREVLVRSRMRLTGRTTLPVPVDYRVSPASGSLGPLAIPPAGTSCVTSIVIPVLNNPELTHRCLQSIVEHTAAGAYEVIVVDNGSGAETRSMLSRIRGLRVIQNDRNVGFVQACNEGAVAAHGEFVLFLNNDTVVLAGWLEALVRMLESDASIGAAGAKLVYPNGRLQEAGSIIWSDGDGWNYGHNEDPEAPEYCYVREVDYCSGACLIVRRAVFAKLGGFDERYSPAYYEDVDLAFRLREHGLRVVYQPAARVVHYGGATGGTDTGSGFKAFQVINRQKFIERHAVALASQYAHDPELLRAARDRRRGRRVLLMDHMVPHHDEDAGSVRMVALLRILTELGCRVTFVPDNFARIEPYTSELQQLGIEVLYGPFHDLSFVQRHTSRFDVAILCRAHFAARYLPLFNGNPSGARPYLIFDTIDLHHLREHRLGLLEKDQKLIESAARTRELELGIMRACDLTWVTSTHEAELLQRESDIRSLGIVPTIHSIRADVPPFSARRDILFIGGFRHPPNEDAVRHFIDDILPAIRKRLPGVRFLVVGSHTPPSIERLASDAVKILGFVRDVTPVFDACRITVAPLRYGAGVKGKITQSLAWGVPTVATPVAAEGMQMVDREHLMIASDPAEFADRVIELYENEAEWVRLSENGRRHIERHLGYAAVRDAVGAMLDRATATRA